MIVDNIIMGQLQKYFGQKVFALVRHIAVWNDTKIEKAFCELTEGS